MQSPDFSAVFAENKVCDQFWSLRECFLAPLHGVGYDLRPVEMVEAFAEQFIGVRQVVRMGWREREALLPHSPVQLVFEMQCQVRWQALDDGRLQVEAQLGALLQEPHLRNQIVWLSQETPATEQPGALVWSTHLARAQATLASEDDTAAWLRQLVAQWETSAVPHLAVLAALRAADAQLGPSDAPLIDAEEFTVEGLQALMQEPAIHGLLVQAQQNMAAAWEAEALPWTDIVEEVPVIQQEPARAQVLWQWHGNLGSSKLAGAARFTVGLQWSVKQQQLHCSLKFERPTLLGQRWHNATVASSEPLNISHATLRNRERVLEWLRVMVSDSATWCEHLLNRKTLRAVAQLNEDAALGTGAEFAMWAGSFGNQPWLYRLMRQADAVLREELSASGFAPHVVASRPYPYASITQVTSDKAAAWAARLAVTPIGGHRDVDITFRIVLKPRDVVATLRVELFAGFSGGQGITKKLVEGTIDWTATSPVVVPDSWEQRTAAVNEALFNAFGLEPADELVPVIRKFAQQQADEMIP